VEFAAAGFRQADLYLSANHLKPEYARTRDPSVRERMVEMYRDALALVTDPIYANRLTENRISQAALERELEVLERSTTFGRGEFTYSDYLVRGGNTAMDAVRKTGFVDGVWGLDMGQGATGELVYDFRARDGVFAGARLTTLALASRMVGARVDVGENLDGPWTTVAAHEHPGPDAPAGLELPVDLTDSVKGKPRFFLKVTLTNQGDGYVCALTNIGVEGEVVAEP
jgi:hypothetical protein